MAPDLPALYRDALRAAGDPRRLLLAVSGGPDSTALLALAADEARESGRFLAVGHVDHGLRRASAGDAAFVRRAAARLGLTAAVLKVPVRRRAAGRGLSGEEAARVLRYEALARLARRFRCPAAAAAHTADDQAETVLINLLRGTGPAGLGGMSPSSPWPVGRGPRLLRPLLGARRGDLRAFLKTRRQPFRRDATNDQPLFLRNRIRPTLAAWEAERPGAVERIARTAALLRDEEAWWERRLASVGDRLELARFKRYDVALQRRLLRRAFGLASHAAVERARAFALDPGPARRQSLPGGWAVKRDGRLLFQELSGGHSRYKKDRS